MQGLRPDARCREQASRLRLVESEVKNEQKQKIEQKELQKTCTAAYALGQSNKKEKIRG